METHQVIGDLHSAGLSVVQKFAPFKIAINMQFVIYLFGLITLVAVRNHRSSA